MIQEILNRAGAFAGKNAAWHMNLATGETSEFNADTPIIAASVIKLWVMAEAFRRFYDGTFDKNTEFVVRAEDKLPSCGALTYMHDGLKVTALDLVTLMIVHSDNTATNMLIKYLGMDAINAFADELGGGARLNRLLFDDEASAKGVQNYVTAHGVGKLLEGIYRGWVVSPEASREMLEILKKQRYRHKIPFFLDCPCANKTGEDDGISHDCAIIFADVPQILVFLGSETDAEMYVRFMQDAAREIVCQTK